MTTRKPSCVTLELSSAIWLVKYTISSLRQGERAVNVKKPHYQCDAPIVGAMRYRNDVVIIRKGNHRPTVYCQRAQITTFSRASRQRLAFIAANTDVTFRTMITLTYPNEFPCNGILVKKDLKAFLRFAREYLFSQAAGERKPSYLWFLEFQARGAPHIHLLLSTKMPSSFKLTRFIRDRVAAAWARIVDSNDPRHLLAGTRCEAIRKPGGAARYAVKYASKMRQKAVPSDFQNVGRFWGHSKDVSPVAREMVQCTEDDVRELLKDWEYAPRPERVVYRILYGQSARFEGRGEPLQADHDNTRSSE
jgi:hypothetical protein